MKINRYYVVLTLIIIFLIYIVPITSLAQDEDSGVGTVEVDGNDIDPFVDLDLDSPDHIQESDKLPTPSQVVLLTVQIAYVDNTSSEINVTLVHDDGTGLTSFINITMLYNGATDSYRANVGGYIAQTILHYYVESYDGKNRIRTPATGYTQIEWDVAATTVATGGGDVIVDIITQVGDSALFIVAGGLLMGFSMMMILVYMYMNNNRNLRSRVDVYVHRRNQR